MIIYKIRRGDGMFSMGGSTPHFNKTGKIWKQRGHLTSHLSQLHNNGGRYRCDGNQQHVYTDCEIVEYEVTEIQYGEGISIPEYLSNIRKRKQQEKIDMELSRRKREKDQRRKQFEELQKEFG